MSQLSERIAQFRKMASDDPDNELGHFRLGQLLMEDKQLDEAVKSFQRTLELSPQFSKVYQLLGATLAQLERKEEALATLKKGYAVADERGDNMPREEMGKLLISLGAEVPAPKQAAPSTAPQGGPGGFRCQRPNCTAGGFAQRLEKPPMNDELGRRIQEQICAACWSEWWKGFSVKLVNELRLDLSREDHVAIYDQHMREFFGFE